MSERFALVVPVPEVRAWQADDARSQWLVLRHLATGSELRLRTWSARRLVDPAECEEQARLWWPAMPDTTQDAAVARRALKAPPGYHGELVAGVRTAPGRAELEGYVVGVGASIGRCYAAIFNTVASGADADERVGHTLGVVVGGILERIRTRDIADRAQRPEFPF